MNNRNLNLLIAACMTAVTTHYFWTMSKLDRDYKKDTARLHAIADQLSGEQL